MKKCIIAAILAGAMLLSGCSRSPSADDNSKQEEQSSSYSSTQTSESTSTNGTGESIDNSYLIGKEQEEKFELKCKILLEILLDSMPNTLYDEPGVQYENASNCLSKVFVIKNEDDDRILIGFLDIPSDDEYSFFQSAKGFISFVEDNVIEIAGRDQFMILINLQEDASFDIDIRHSGEVSSITYADRRIRSAYSDRFKSIDLFKDSAEHISLPGLIRYDDVSKLYEPYDISYEYNGKTLTHKWYKLEDEQNLYVTYIDDGTYTNMSDEELIFYVYASSYVNGIEGATQSLNDGYYFAYKSGKEVACEIRYYTLGNRIISFVCTWHGEYEHLNSNPLNTQLLNQINNN